MLKNNSLDRWFAGFNMLNFSYAGLVTIMVSVRLTGNGFLRKATNPLFMEENEKFWRLLARQLSGETSDSEKEELQQLLENDPLLRQAASVVSAVWQNPAAEGGDDVQRRVSSLLDRIKKKEEL
jgi:hypothetical protein